MIALFETRRDEVKQNREEGDRELTHRGPSVAFRDLDLTSQQSANERGWGQHEQK